MRKCFFLTAAAMCLGTLAVFASAGSGQQPARPRAAERSDGPRAVANPRAVAVEVIILTTKSGAEGDEGASLAGPTEKTQARIRELEKKGRIVSIERVRLSTLENQTATMQSGRTEAVAAGSTLFGRGQSTRSATAYRQENVGTLVSLTPRVAGDAVVMEISVEKSQLRPAAREPEETPAGMEQLVAKTTLKIERGMTVVVGGSSISAAGTTTTQVVLASAEIVGKPAQPNEDKTKARPAEDAVELRVFELHNAMAETAATIVIKSFKAKTTPISVTIDERSNLLIVRGPRSVMAAIDALLSRIDRK